MANAAQIVTLATLIPVGDENPKLNAPWMTWLIMGVTLALWLLIQGAGLPSAVAASVCDLGMVPARSGAISGIMGAYLLLYPSVRVRMLFIFIVFFKIIPIPAWIVLVYWFFVQLLAGLPQLSSVRPDVSSGVAVWAHIGGFLAGIILIRLFERPELVVRHKALLYQMQQAR